MNLSTIDKNTEDLIFLAEMGGNSLAILKLNQIRQAAGLNTIKSHEQHNQKSSLVSGSGQG